MNHLNGSFNAQQARAIEKYVADFVAVVLKNAGEGHINPGEYKVPVDSKPKAQKGIQANDKADKAD